MKKKIISFSIAVLLTFLCAVPAFARDEAMPKIMVTDFSVEDPLKAGSKGCVFVKITNRSRSVQVKSIKISFSDPVGDIVPVGVTSGYVERLGAGKTTEWKIPVSVSENAQNGNHAVVVSFEFECEAGQGSSSDTINLNVEGKTETTQPATEPTNPSKPYLMITECSVDSGHIVPGESRELKITLKNMSGSRSVENIKLTLTCADGEIKVDGRGSVFVPYISAGKTYVWSVPLTAVYTAKTGEHELALSCEYEDSNRTQFTSSDKVTVDVRQSVRLDHDQIRLQKTVYQGETVTLSITFMNTGKTPISNVIVGTDIDGLENGGTVMVGEIPSGESKVGSVNLRVSETMLGKTQGKVMISYEDDLGKTYEEVADVSTSIEPPKISAQDEEKTSKFPLWWLFMLIGIILGGALGFGIPFAIRSRKQMLEDEKRL